MTSLFVFKQKERTHKNLLVFFMLWQLNHVAHAQAEDSMKIIDHFSGSIAVTNNGISLVPTFSLGDPAAIINLKMAKKDFSFEPEMRFSLEGKPWSFLFWFRYKVIKEEKFSLRVGIHPAYNFRTTTANVNGIERDLIETRRYIAGEIAPNYKLAKNISIGVYYLYSKGLDEGLKNGHFATLNSDFSNVALTQQWFLNINPSIYYLKLDQNDGVYTTATVTLKKKAFPLALQTIFNQRVESNIVSDNLVWNISLLYSF